MSIDLDHKLSVLAAAEEVPDAVAVRSNGDCLTYRELAKKVRDILPRLGDARPYPLVARPDLETLIKVFALLERKQPILLLHPGLTEHERNTLLSSVEGLDHHLPEDTAVILFTSGTTGLPKPAILTREALTASAEASRDNIPLSPGDVWQLSISPARIGGFSILTRSLIARSAIALGPKFSPKEYLRRLEVDHVTYSSIVPTMLRMIFDEAPEWRPVKTLKALLVGGAPTSEKLKAEAEEKGIPIILTYGMTETASNVVTTPFAERYQRTSGSGKINKGVQIKSEDGHLFIKGPMLMHGYWGREPLVPGAWFDSGDIGEVDPDGSVRVFARRKDVILSGGENVYPAEVEEALETIPEVKEALVLGLPDETWGAIVTALLVPKDEQKLPSDAELALRLKPILASYKSPRRIAWVKELPKTKAGKPDRNADNLKEAAFRTLHYKH